MGLWQWGTWLGWKEGHGEHLEVVHNGVQALLYLLWSKYPYAYDLLTLFLNYTLNTFNNSECIFTMPSVVNK